MTRYFWTRHQEKKLNKFKFPNGKLSISRKTLNNKMYWINIYLIVYLEKRMGFKTFGFDNKSYNYQSLMNTVIKETQSQSLRC